MNTFPDRLSDLSRNHSGPRILVVDDDPDVLDVVARLLGAHNLFAEVFVSAEELLSTVTKSDFGCVVTDLEMPGINGIELQTKLKTMNSCLAVVVITAYANVPKAIKIMGLGATTLLEKPFKAAELVAEVHHAVEVSRQALARIERLESAIDRIATLSDEELEVMLCAARGLPNKAIAQQLVLSPRTVDRRRQAAMLKLGVVSVADFVVLYAAAREPSK
jgi:two-component system, LuxR family, response regulator FixJ